MMEHMDCGVCVLQCSDVVTAIICSMRSLPLSKKFFNRRGASHCRNGAACGQS